MVAAGLGRENRSQRAGLGPMRGAGMGEVWWLSDGCGKGTPECKVRMLSLLSLRRWLEA